MWWHRWRRRWRERRGRRQDARLDEGADDDGAATVFRGSLVKPGEMRYVTEKPLPGGPNGEKRVRLRHWTLSAMPDGTIRELAVGTEDGGQSWTTDYDLKWVRRK